MRNREGLSAEPGGLCLSADKGLTGGKGTGTGNKEQWGLWQRERNIS